MNKNKVVLAASGGLDSTVVWTRLIRSGWDVLPVWVWYGSRHNDREHDAVANIGKHFGVEVQVLDMRHVFAGSPSALMQGGVELPKGHYEEESMRQTVVPARNLVILSALASYAAARGASAIATGVHAGDHFIYPDCRPGFLTSFQETLCHALGEESKLDVISPFTMLHKKDIVNIGLDIGAPLELTRTCYSSDEIACGTCGSCQERLEAFSLLQETDPISYRTRELQPKA
jgi:7-cyano-7-deazaguanine synthase